MTSPWVKPGEMLGYAQRLKKEGLWPPRPGAPPPGKPGDVRPATAYIVIPAQDGDQGNRPIADTSWIDNPSIKLLNTATQQIEDHPRMSATYNVVAAIRNLGDAPVLGGFAEFYVGDPIWIDNALGIHVGNPEPNKPKWLGVTPFSLGIRGRQIVKSQKTWTPAADFDLSRALFVRAFDPFADKVTAEWDSWTDRHVARRDLAPDFSGTWEGTEFWRPRLRHLPQLHPVGTFKIHIDASGGMKQKSPFKSDGSYPRGNFECNVRITALPNITSRVLNLPTVTNVQYQRGALQWVLYSTDSNDPHAVRGDFKLTEQADGHLHMECSWGPDLMASVAGQSHATLHH
jgi:hypothetical protein